MASRSTGTGQSPEGAGDASGTRYRQVAETLVAILNAIPARVALVDEHGTIIAANDAWQRVANEPNVPGSGFHVGRNYLDLCGEMQMPAAVISRRAAAGLRRVLAGEAESFTLEYLGQRTGPQRWYRMMVTPARDGELNGAVITHLDITEIKVAEVRATHLSRLHAMSSGIKAAIVRILDPGDLCTEACRIAVEEGGLVMAWVGTADTPDGRLQPLARWGRDEGYLDAIQVFRTADRPEGLGPGGEAFRTGRPARCNDIATAGDTFASRDAALARGFRSCAAFPLRRDGQVFGVMAVYGDRPGFFDDEVVDLLDSLAGDLSLALEAAGRKARRQAAETALRASEERFRQLAENINQVFWITDPAKDQMLYVSPAYAKIWGRSCESLYREPRGWLDAIHPEDRERVALAARTRQALAAYDETYRILRPDGTQRWVRDRAFPVRNAAGEVYRIVGIAADVTERVLSAEKLAEQAALLDKAKDAILVVDLRRRVTYWNQGAERLYGVPAAEAVGRDIGELMQSEAGVGRRAMEEIKVRGEWTGELRQTTRSGVNLIVECHWTLVRDEEGRPKSVLAINTDVTEKKRLEAEFLRIQRMESIGTLAGGIAHDLNNVLAPIMMAVEMLQQHVVDPEGRNLLVTLQDTAQRGADLVKQVLTFARGVEGTRLPVQPLEILRGIQKIVRDTFPKNIRFDLQGGGEPLTVLGDSTQLHQVFMNLLVNARDALPNGGRIAVRVEPVRVEDTLGGLNPEARPGDYVLVGVADSGMGIPAERWDRIFEPFYTTKELGKGTGLGLSTTLAIVRSHGGFIRVRSEPGQGAAFQVYLPAGVAAEAGSRDRASAATPRGRGELILVVDDEEPIRRIASRILERYGYRVVTAAHGAEAASVYARRRNEIALVITDMAMPIMDGPALVRALRAMNPAVRIIGSSGLSGPADVMADATGKHAAALEHFVAKPYTAEGLLTVVRKSLDGG